MTKKHWYKLDNVGNFYSLTNNSTIPAVFKYSVTLKDNVDSKILQQALEQSLNYFPNFNCHLKKGFFWLYLEASDKKVYVAKENKPICSKIYKDEDDILFRVNFYEKRINLEISHIISDGRGSLNFFKCIVYKYLILKYDIKNVEIETGASNFEKNEDSFDKYYTRPKFKFSLPKKIYKYKNKKKKDTTYIEYHISVSKTLELPHKYKVSLTSLLTAVLIKSYINQMKRVEFNKTIKIDIPVDLRQYFKSYTSRNFFGLVSILYKNDGSNDSLEEIINTVNEQLKSKVNIDNLKVRMNNMIYFEKNLAIRFVPIFIKDIVLKIADYLSSQGCTSSISNIGEITVNEKLEKYIENFNVLSTTNTLKITACSYKDDLSIGFSSKYISNDVIKDFCRFFSKNEIYGVINISGDDCCEKM